MKQITLNIPDDKYTFFLELMENLGFEKTDELTIPQEHKDIVRERIRNSKPDELISWDEARKKLKFKA